MRITRRQFIKGSLMLGTIVSVGGFDTFLSPRRAFAFEQSPTNLRKFIIGLPGLGPSAKNEIGQYIPVAIPNAGKFKGSDYYTLVAGQYNELMHPDLPKATKLWG